MKAGILSPDMKSTLAVLFLFFNCSLKAQLRVLDKHEYEQQIQSDPGLALQPLSGLLPSVRQDLKYARRDNFMHMRLYDRQAEAYLRREALDSLKKVSETLAAIGFGLKIWDAYRPYSLTRKMWDKIHDNRYVADPKTGSGHNRGTTVDLTLYDLKTGQELDMGTVFDDFSEKAASKSEAITVQQQVSRTILLAAMTKHGFVALDTEWWHFSLFNSKKYDLLDVDFKTLKKLKTAR